MLNKTPKGAEVLQSRSLSLPPRQRTLLLLANGTRSTDELLRQTAGLSGTQADIDYLIAIGLLEDSTPVFAATNVGLPPLDPRLMPPSQAGSNELNDLRDAAFQVRDELASGASVPAGSSVSRAMPMSTQDANTRPLTDAERFEQAYRTATKLSSELGLRAFRLQLALERASTLDEIKDLRPKLLEALIKESGEAEAQRRIRPLDRLLR